MESHLNFKNLFINIIHLSSRAILAVLVLLTLGSCVKTGTSSSSDSSDAATLSECTLNTASTAACKATTVGSIVTTTSGANVTSWANGTGSTSVSANIPNGFYSGKRAIFTDALLLASNIKYGVTIFGVTGTDSGNSSGAFRDLNTTQLSLSTEAVSYAGLALPGVANVTSGYAYREVPNVSKDDDGYSGGSVTYVNRLTPIDWTGSGGRTCGSAGTLEARISDCAVTLGSSQASWSGSTNGNGPQATWQIVSRTGNCGTSSPSTACKEVWRDYRTKLLWSSRVSESLNWCVASGANNITNNTFAAADPSSYCDNIANQETSGQADSACYDDNNNKFDNTGNAAITNTSGKAGLSKASTPAVSWRLPTLADYKQAEIDGIRFVLPDMGSNSNAATYEWTSTVKASVRTTAWAIDANLGLLSATTRTATTAGARCVGR